MRKLFGFLTGKIPVLLESKSGQIYPTLASKQFNPFTQKYQMTAPVYWFSKVGHAILHEDGTTTGDAIYIKRWIKG